MGVSTTVGEGETKSHKILELDEKVVSILHDCLLSGVHCQSKCDVTVRGARRAVRNSSFQIIFAAL